MLNRELQAELKGKGSMVRKPAKRLPNPPRVLLSFQDVTYTVKKTKKQILKGVTGWFAPGTLTAILGTSGCGKTTLLNVLADQVGDAAETTGEIYVNAQQKSNNYRRLCAYVLQTDTFLESLTVRETLWFTAEFRLEDSVSQANKIKVINQTLLDLDLDQVADRKISVLSGGQKRRVTVAIELIARPSLIFLDEPTTGLDASGTLKLVTVLRNLANQGRTIICTIHQPRIDAFNLFHMVLLMNSGQSLYFGPVSEVIDYFYSTKMVSLVNQKDIRNNNEETEPINPADFVLDLTHSSLEEVEYLTKYYQESSLSKSIFETCSELHQQRFQPEDFFGFTERKEW